MRTESRHGSDLVRLTLAALVSVAICWPSFWFVVQFLDPPAEHGAAVSAGTEEVDVPPQQAEREQLLRALQATASDDSASTIVRGLSPGRVLLAERVSTQSVSIWRLAIAERRPGSAAISYAPALMHVMKKNLRQKNEPYLIQLGWRTAPYLAGHGLFWNGPRLLELEDSRYRRCDDFPVLAAYVFRWSPLMWVMLAMAAVLVTVAGADLGRALTHTTAANFTIVAAVVLIVRVTAGVLQGDGWDTVLWVWPHMCVMLFFGLCAMLVHR